MKAKALFLIVVAATAQTSCSLPVKEGDIDWRFQTLSKQGCPNLSGAYYEGAPAKVVDGCTHSWCSDKLYPVGLYLLMTGGSSTPLVPGTTFDERRVLPERANRTTYVSEIAQTNDSLRVALRDIGGVTYIVGTIPLDRTSIGCTGGALIFRNVRSHSMTESGKAGVSYSESKIEKLANGSVRAEVWHAFQSRNSLTGKVEKPVRDATHRVWTFAPAISQR